MKKTVVFALILALLCAICPAEEDISRFEEPTGTGVYEGIIEISEAVQQESSAPFIPEGLEPYEPSMNILGYDDRVTVWNTSKYPYSAICYIVSRRKCGCEATGTGFMVSKNCMMTAAHCVICHNHNSPIEKVDFYFGYDGSDGYLYRYNGSFTYWTGTGFPDGYNNGVDRYDYAYIRFDKNVGEYTGWFGLNSLTDSEARNGYFCLAGYKWGVMKYNWGTCDIRNDFQYKFTMDMEPGNSGSPIFDSDYYVSSIVTNHKGDGTENYSWRVNWDVITQMRNNGMFS